MDNNKLLLLAVAVGALYVLRKRQKTATMPIYPTQPAIAGKPIENKNVNGDMWRSILGAGWGTLKQGLDISAGGGTTLPDGRVVNAEGVPTERSIDDYNDDFEASGLYA